MIRFKSENKNAGNLRSELCAGVSGEVLNGCFLLVSLVESHEIIVNVWFENTIC